MSYKVNGKNLAIGRLMVRGKDPKKAPARLKYLACGPKGTTVVTPSIVARVSLPEAEQGRPLGSLLYTQEELDAIPRPAPESSETVQLPEGQPCVDGPNFMVPKMDSMFFTPTEDMPSFIVNADMLRKLLTVASEVCNDSEKVTRIRFDKTSNSIRLDVYRVPGEQEFTAVMKCMKCGSSNLPGFAVDAPAPLTDEKAVQGSLTLKVESGRKFRGEGE